MLAIPARYKPPHLECQDAVTTSGCSRADFIFLRSRGRCIGVAIFLHTCLLRLQFLGLHRLLARSRVVNAPHSLRDVFNLCNELADIKSCHQSKHIEPDFARIRLPPSQLADTSGIWRR
jgi:hypothetical protein